MRLKFYLLRVTDPSALKLIGQGKGSFITNLLMEIFLGGSKVTLSQKAIFDFLQIMDWANPLSRTRNKVFFVIFHYIFVSQTLAQI